MVHVWYMYGTCMVQHKSGIRVQCLYIYLYYYYIYYFCQYTSLCPRLLKIFVMKSSIAALYLKEKTDTCYSISLL